MEYTLLFSIAHVAQAQPLRNLGSYNGEAQDKWLL